MTTIDEDMDEFFNFEDAAHPLDHSTDIDFTDFPSGPYDVNLAFADQQNDEDSFTCLQHFSSPEEQLNLDAQMDTTMLSPADFTDFARWIDGSGVPIEPCAYCRRMRIHCKIIYEGLRKGSCTSCVALARSCSLTHDPSHSLTYNPPGTTQQEDNDKYRCSQAEFCLPGNTISSENGDVDHSNCPQAQACEQCEYCRSRGYQCKYIQEDGRVGACTSCVALVRHCSLAPVDDLADWKIDDGMDATNTWIPSKSPLESPIASSHNRSAPNLLSLRSSEENMDGEANESNPKIGARFSRDSVRILRGWLSTHHRHPYPTDEEKEGLQRQTGLNKTQITNWLANARRRGKVRAPRSTSPSVSNYSKAMDIPRRATPALENMNPLERWKHSPPENEPASVTAIAKAVTSSTWSSGRDSPYATSYGRSDDGSGRSLCNVSSTSSLGTSHSSGGSFASAFSHKSQGSFGSFGSLNINANRGRRRRRRQAPKPVKVPNMNGPIRTFQCTFCTETFKTKHDWQRHEKSLHLSLERWICCPNGSTQFSVEYDQMRCVFCGLPNPPDGHAEMHNFSSCADRSLEERTFYRKDHLRQHLNLVHDAKFQGFSMECWKVVTPEIRSRCGFCGVVMGSWTFRVDHLAEHFKGGKSMADWKGDWGFDPQVLDIVENGMPPYLIHDERNSVKPYEASKEKPHETRTLEDLIKIGLVEYVHDRILKGGVPTDEELLTGACQIVRRSDELLASPGDIEVSWFRDLILLSGDNAKVDENTMQPTSVGFPWTKKLELINGSVPYTCKTDDSVIKCQKERALKLFVDAQQALGLTPTDSHLQLEACRILSEMEKTSNFKSKPALGWFKYLATASTKWLDDFRRRAGLPRTSEMGYGLIRSTDDKSIDYSIHNQATLEQEMIAWVNLQRALDISPSDADIQNHARLVYKNDPWNQTFMDDPAILHLFKRQRGLAPQNEDGPDMPPLSEALELGVSQANLVPSPKNLHWELDQNALGLPSPSSAGSGNNSATGTGALTPNHDHPLLHTTIQNQPSANSNPVMPLKYFLNDANCYGRLVRELSRFVTTCTSANNPNRHIPTDAEIQNQARWVIYDDDDPWNQTAADNAEWLIRFKRNVGLAPPTEGPGLPVLSSSWQVAAGGSGFCPPYLNAKSPPSFNENEPVPVRMEDKVYQIKATTAQKFITSMAERYQPPASVFCSRELENGLNNFVHAQMTEGNVPSDEELKAEARLILGTEQTAADDPLLLEKFKALHGIVTDYNLRDVLAQFDAELEMGMDFSSAEMTDVGLGIGGGGGVGGEIAAQIPGGEITPGMRQEEQTQLAMGVAKEYADLYRVQTTTASPLRRRATENMAESKGFKNPLPLPTTH
ncbi:Homeobox protein 4 [Lachnellula arida]|uniref:Homeobox protein 4 n=1 Tax=Lachnellula arida TaxID=1316785 RepID=A0A8T9BFY2_9HELO|nr:Homeobox protein 4 [Lachnellula arida]